MPEQYPLPQSIELHNEAVTEQLLEIEEIEKLS